MTAPDGTPRSTHELHREQVAETEDLGTGAGYGFTRAQTKGFIGGALGVGAIGAILFLPFGFIAWGTGTSLALRLVVAAVIGFLAGAAVGAVYWGGRQPELEGEAEGTVGLGGGETVLTERGHHTEPRQRTERTERRQGPGNAA